MKRRYVIGIIVAVIIIGAAFAVTYFYKEGERVRIGYLKGDMHHLSAFVAFEKGYFDFDYEKVGPFNNGMYEMQALHNNEVDIAFVGGAPAIIEAVHNNDVIIVAQINTEGSAIVGIGDIHNATDLEGKKVAYPGPGTVQDMLIRKYMTDNGADPSKVDGGQFIKLRPVDMPFALKNGDIDAFIAWEPFCAEGVGNGGHIISESKYIWPGQPCCVLAVRKAFALQHPQIVEKAVKAHINATNFVNQNFNSTTSEMSDELYNIVKKYIPLEKSVIKDAMSRIGYQYEMPKDNDVYLLGIYLQYLIEHDTQDKYFTPEEKEPFMTNGSIDADKIAMFVDEVTDERYLEKVK